MSDNTTSRADGDRGGQGTALEILGGPAKLRELAMAGKMEDSFKEMNPKGYQRIRQSVMLAFVKNPKLYNCTRISVIDALCKAIAYNLETDGVMGRAYLIPRWNGALRMDECHFQLGYKGLAEFFYRANPGAIVDGGVACDGDIFDYEMGTACMVTLRKGRERKDITHFWTYYRLANGNQSVHVMTVEEMLDFCQEYRSDKAKTQSNKNYRGVWDIRFDQMGIKTSLSQLLKRAPLSVEAQEAITEDEYRTSGRFGIQELDGKTSLKAIDETPPEEVAAKDDQPAKRNRLGKKAAEATPAEPISGSSVTPVAPLPPSPPEVLDGALPKDWQKFAGSEDPNRPCELCQRPMRAHTWKEGIGNVYTAYCPTPLAPASPAKVPPAAPPAPAKIEAYQDAPALPVMEWDAMTDAEIYETWSSLEKPQRVAYWKAMAAATQQKVASANEHFSQKEAKEETSDASGDMILQQAKDHINKLSPDEQVAWLLANRFSVPSDKRSPMSAAAGVDPKKLLSENGVDVINKLAISMCAWLIGNKVNIKLPPKAPVKSGRPGPTK